MTTRPLPTVSVGRGNVAPYAAGPRPTRVVRKPLPELACANRGEPTGETRACPTCSGNVRVKLFACKVYGSCALGTAPGVGTCSRACPGFSAPAVAAAPFVWVSTADLAREAVRLAALLPLDVVGIVGLPRSGMIPASIIATLLHLPLYELSGGQLRQVGHGSRGRTSGFADRPGRLAVVDDTVYGGGAMRAARAEMKAIGRPAVFAAVYSRLPAGRGAADLVARDLPSPHLLEWNVANNGPLAGHAANPVYGRGVALDLDGVIVHDAESGGRPGAPYLPPRMHPVPLIATGRPERHRAGTEAALRAAGVKWDRLEMMPDDVEHTAQSAAAHKARHYAASGCGFYVESDPLQAELIHWLSRKPVVCPITGQVWTAGTPRPLVGPLLPLTAVAPIFAPLVGKRVGLVHSPATGNAGDRLLERAAEQLLTAFGIEWRVVEPAEPGDSDALVLFGGANFGRDDSGRPLCVPETDRRRVAACMRPCVVLPVTAHGPEPTAFGAVYVRDVASLARVPGAVLAPDLALCYRPERPLPPPIHAAGEFFKRTPSGLQAGRGTDPRHDYADPRDYLDFVALHAEIHTDCLHVAICGLIARRRVTIYPTRLSKNRGVWEAWLRLLGCAWGE